MGASQHAAGWSRAVRRALLFLAMAAVLTWNFLTGALVPSSIGEYTFDAYQIDSEDLVAGPIEAQRRGVDTGRYGLGRYADAAGQLYAYATAIPDDGQYPGGFSVDGPVVRIDWNFYTETLVERAKYISFTDIGTFAIVSIVSEEPSYFYLYLDAPGPLSEETAGPLADAVFYDGDGQALPAGAVKEYQSQMGLQGFVFRFLARFLGDRWRGALRGLCSLATALVCTGIVFLLGRRYDRLLAACFYAVFLLSPWVVFFSKNLYWVAFTWFLPTLFGLVCACGGDRPRLRRIGYAGAFASVLVRCLCGYEYISTVMAASVAFLCADLIAALAERDRKKAARTFRTLLTVGLLELAAFALALILHAYLRGGGHIGEGLELIYRQDALRRTWGADRDTLPEEYWASLDAGALEVLTQYFRFYTPVITGLPGTVFPYLAALPAPAFLAVWALDRKFPAWEAGYWAVSLLAAASWFVLAKSHSYIHTHMSYVLWYFGFVQCCFYSVFNVFRRAAGRLPARRPDAKGGRG